MGESVVLSAHLREAKGFQTRPNSQRTAEAKLLRAFMLKLSAVERHAHGLLFATFSFWQRKSLETGELYN